MRTPNHTTLGNLIRVLLPVAVIMVSGSSAWPQSSVRTRTFAFGKPVLVLKGEIVAANGDSMLSAGAGGTLALSISNTGQATARNPVMVLKPAATLKDISVARTDTLDDLAPGETRTEKVPVGFPATAPAEKGALRVSVSANPGPVRAETRMEIAVRDVPFPKFDARIIGPQGGVIAGETVRLGIRVMNSGTGEARGVAAVIAPDSAKAAFAGPNKRASDRTLKEDIGALASGASHDIALDVRVLKEATGNITIVVGVTGENTTFGYTDTLSVHVLSAAAAMEARGFVSFRRGDYRGAAGLFEKLLSTGKASKEACYALGVSYFKLQNQPRCIAVMQKASSMGNEDAKNWLADHANTVETVTVVYAGRTADPFEGYSQPIGLGILPFTDAQMQSTPLTDKMYEALRKKNKTFRILPYSTIESEKTALHLTSLSPSNSEILAGMERDFSMNFAVGGTTGDTTAAVFTMQILRCRDGQLVYSQEFRNSKTSTAVNDAVRFLLEGKVPLYKRTRTVEVKPQ